MISQKNEQDEDDSGGKSVVLHYVILLKFEWNKWLILSKVILYIPEETDTPNEDFLDSFVSTTSACFYDWDNYFLSLDSFSIAVSVHFDCNELSFHFAIMWTKGFQISAISKS